MNERKRIALVVEDSAPARMMLSRSLQELGFRTVEAEHGSQALKLLRDGTEPDVALIDWNMPVMDGIEFVKEAKENGLVHCPLMMVTTESSLSQVKVALSHGVTEFLMKPFDVEMLKDKLNLLGFELS